MPADPRQHEAFARLARDQSEVRSAGTRARLGPRVARLEQRLADAFRRLAARRYPPGELPSAVEWLRDNDHVIQDALDQVRGTLVQGFYRRLPVSRRADDEGRPRVEVLARLLVDRLERPLELDTIIAALDAYQAVAPLRVGELWALPALLRLALLEDVAPAAAALSGEPTAPVRGGPGSRPTGPSGAEAAHADAEADTDATGSAGRADPERIADVVRSLRTLASADWRAWFERCSVLDHVLRTDPAGHYAAMAFATRDRYRREVEALAAGAPDHDEVAVARSAVALAEAAREQRREQGPEHLREQHVGTYLVAEGRDRLEAEIGYRPPPMLRLGRAVEPHATTLYTSTIVAFGLLALLVPLAWLAAIGSPLGTIIGAALLVTIPAWSLAASVVDWLVTLVVPARRLPRMDPDAGIPEDARTLVVMPVILRSAAEVAPLLARLEVNYLGNRDANLTHALLTDLADAETRQQPGDEAVIDALSQGIRDLNARYAVGEPLFHLLHRERRWNPIEHVWMGWERKRGKLEELNALVTGQGGTSFSLRVDAPADLEAVRYVLTLDADTRLPPGSARELIAVFRHPLNRPLLDPSNHDLEAGFTVIQPRVETDAAAALETTFSRVMVGQSGVDLYSQTISNVHHDLFGRGIFVGKGVYHVEAFERRLRGQVPENQLLSHDLFEGVQGRVGLASDVVLFEQVPANALQHAQRLHRWVRGDWQLLPWLLSRTPPGRDGAARGLGTFERWQIADNLRRSLYLPALLALFVGAWLTLPWPAVLTATLGLLALLALPIPLAVLAAVRRGVPGRAIRPLWEAVIHDVRLEAARWAVMVVLLPHLALVTSDAIGRALYRVYVSRRGLLQWTTAAHAAQSVGATVPLPVALRAMGGAAALTGALVALLALFAPAALPAALPLLLAWALAPAITSWTSRPRVRIREWLSDGQRRTLRLLARRTWFFFAETVGPRDNWLPPDHLQEDPGPMLARRTSPTNIGMMLASTLGAFDLGFLEARQLASRVRNTLDTLDQLERYRGHWLNWYGTHDLMPLEPRYVSAVDSGNLAASLLVVARGLEDARREGVVYPARTRGLADTVAVLGDVVARLPRLGSRDARSALGRQQQALAALEARLREAATAPFRQRRDAVAHAEETLQSEAEALAALLEAHPEDVPFAAVSELRAWVDQAVVEARATSAEIAAAAPWLDLLDGPPVRRATGGFDDTLRHLLDALAEPADLAGAAELAARGRSLVLELEGHLEGLPEDEAAAARAWTVALVQALDEAVARAAAVDTDLLDAARRCRAAAVGMDFSFLYDADRDLLHLGYHVSAGEFDPNHYDLLASEARTASLLAIAKGDVPVAHWLQLGRPLARVAGARVLLSWSATMFEYLMPRLFMRHPERTLMHESCHAALAQQIAFAQRHRVPWGVSESAFAELGVNGDYQYRAFGVPGVGLKADLGRRVVIAPYASALALPLRPREAMANLMRLMELGALGRYGMIDAVDYGETEDSTTRLLRVADDGPTAAAPRLVRTYMAHHQGMLMLAATNQLLHDRMVERFHAEPEIASVELLLHERIPVQLPAPTRWRQAEAAAAEPGAQGPEPVHSWTVDPRGGIGHAMPLSNGATAVLARATGGGPSRWGGVALTRDQPHDTGGARGMLVYLRDLDDGDLWTTTLDPSGGDPRDCEVTFAPHQVRYRRRRGELVVRDTWLVADQDPLDVRRVSLTNEGDRTRRVALASYAEVVLASPAEDARHPAFVKLFVETDVRDDRETLVFHSRRKTAQGRAAVLAHRLVLAAGTEAERTACTDRRAFIGRGRDLRTPLGVTLRADAPPPTPGATLDPIASLGCVLELPPGRTIHAVFVSASGWSEEAALATLRRCDSLAAAARLAERAEAAAVTELRGLGIASDELPMLTDLLALAHAPRQPLRAALDAAGSLLPVLWSQGISGDLPIVLLRVTDEASLPFVVRLLRSHAWWRSRQAGVDLVLLDEVSRGYDRPVFERLERAVHEIGRLGRLQGPGQVRTLTIERIGSELPTLLAAAAVVLDAAGPPLEQQLARAAVRPTPLPAFVPMPGQRPLEPEIAPLAALLAAPRDPPAPPHTDAGAVGLGGSLPRPPAASPAQSLPFAGLGGYAGELVLDEDAPTDEAADFDADDVVLHLEPGQRPPAPWINVIANDRFGFLVSDSGASTTWGANSGERRLTPWPNDPVRDPTGEAIYVRDEETGAIWTPTPAPAPAEAAYRVRHGAGVTTFTHDSHGLEQELRLFVDPEAPVKLLTLRLRDRWQRSRRLTVSAYVEWVLGSLRERQAPFIVPEHDAETGALLARTLLGPMADGEVAFLAASLPPHGLTTDRQEFLGPEQDPARPAGLRRVGLSHTVQGGLDPCGVMQVHVDLAPGASTELHFVLGLGADRDAALALVRRFQAADEARASLSRVQGAWRERLGRIVVRTPEPELDHAINRWLPYQALACRVLGRTALYQSSGAFGFRDQLQDAANLAPLEPDVLRAQLLRAAARQFEEGDVLHWWHPDSGAGVRTLCSDDLLWLPWACARYLERTGDESVLHERVPYLQAAPLGEGEAERFDHYPPGPLDGTLLEHCVRAIDRGNTRGPRGLPLIGSGDWNDGMNRLGLEGQGESVWLGWFLCAVLADGAALCERVGDAKRAARYRARREDLAADLERHAWDGAWYRRAYADDGQAIGSAERREARIDLIAQAWSVLSGAGDPQRAATAMASARERLWHRDERLLLLLTPPFEHEDPDPGYIRDYPPGVRENGGQYTHGAVWGAWAMADLGDGDAAVELLRSLAAVGRAATVADAERYRVEPYVVAADVYGAGPYRGRGGWTWYTGAAGWTYRFGLERVLGVRLLDDRLEIDPCIAADWPSFEVTLRHGAARYRIEVSNPERVHRGVVSARLDGEPLPVTGGATSLTLRDDGADHRVEVRLGGGAAQSEA